MKLQIEPSLGSAFHIPIHISHLTSHSSSKLVARRSELLALPHVYMSYLTARRLLCICLVTDILSHTGPFNGYPISINLNCHEFTNSTTNGIWNKSCQPKSWNFKLNPFYVMHFTSHISHFTFHISLLTAARSSWLEARSQITHIVSKSWELIADHWKLRVDHWKYFVH